MSSRGRTAAIQMPAPRDGPGIHTSNGERRSANWCIANTGAAHMSKGMDQKKNTKKKPAKSLMEKRAAKADKARP
jgi:hypothetical protein